MKFSPELYEALGEAMKVLSAPNVSVAGGELAFRKYLAALDVVALIQDLALADKAEEQGVKLDG